MKNHKSCVRQVRNCAWLLLFSFLLDSGIVIASDWIYTVRPGDNLWNLSKKYLNGMQHLPKLEQLNKITNSQNIPPGTRIRIPLAWLKKQPASAQVIHAQGEVTITHAAGEQPESKPTEVTLYVGDSIVTGPNSNATLEFADKSRLLLQSNSELVMDTLSKYGDSGMVDTQLRMPAGRVDTQVTPAKGPASRYEITTPAAVAAVRGTDFRVNAEPGKLITRSEVLSGNVGVESEMKVTEVPAGFGTVTEAGKPSIPPRKLLPAPDIENTTSLFKKIPVNFEWSHVKGAQSYRFQVFSGGEIEAMLFDEVIPNNHKNIGDQKDGEYILRIRAVDDVGLEGLNRDHVFTVDARPFSPTPLHLIDDKKIRTNKPVFQWSKEDGAKYYHFQLARDADFKDMLIDLEKYGKTKIDTTEILPDGRLYWRVASIDEQGQRGPFTESESFQVRPLPPAPFVHPAIIDKKNIYFKWDSIAGDLEYFLEIATDEDFTEMYMQHSSKLLTLVLPRPMPEIYYYRVKVINNSGDASKFSKTQRIEVPPLSYWPMIFMFVPLLL